MNGQHSARGLEYLPRAMLVRHCNFSLFWGEREIFYRLNPAKKEKADRHTPEDGQECRLFDYAERYSLIDSVRPI